MIHCVGKTLAMNVKSNLPHIVSMLRKSDTNRFYKHILCMYYTYPILYLCVEKNYLPEIYLFVGKWDIGVIGYKHDCGDEQI